MARLRYPCFNAPARKRRTKGFSRRTTGFSRRIRIMAVRGHYPFSSSNEVVGECKHQERSVIPQTFGARYWLYWPGILILLLAAEHL